MIIIEHRATKGRFRYPSTNSNVETYEGFTQVQYVPREFALSTNQDPTDVPDYHQYFLESESDTVKVNYPAQPKDPLDQYKGSDKLW